MTTWIEIDTQVIEIKNTNKLPSYELAKPGAMLADKIPLYSTYGLVGPHILKTTMQRNAFLTALKFLINLISSGK